MNKLKTFDSSYFIGKSHFDKDGTQNYLVFQPINKYFQVITNTDYVSLWKSKGLSAESINRVCISKISMKPWKFQGITAGSQGSLDKSRWSRKCRQGA